MTPQLVFRYTKWWGIRMSSATLRHPAYAVLRKAIVEETGPFVIVAGSGLSAPADLPNWRGLRKIVEHQIDELEYSNRQTGTPFDKGLFAQVHDAEDYWLFFKLAKKALTPATFREIIRSSLDSGSKPVPMGYTELLKLKPKGLVTLNLVGLLALPWRRQGQACHLPQYMEPN
jgi:hypothetical protein